MLVYGGYISDKAEYLKDIYSFDLINHTWEICYKSGKANEPVGRSNLSMVEYQDGFIIFGGTDGSQTLNDLWSFNFKTQEWKQIDTQDTPEVHLFEYSQEEVTRWSSFKVVSSCLEEFKTLPSKRMTFTFSTLINVNGTKFILLPIPFMTARRPSKAAR